MYIYKYIYVTGQIYFQVKFILTYSSLFLNQPRLFFYQLSKIKRAFSLPSPLLPSSLCTPPDHFSLSSSLYHPYHSSPPTTPHPLYPLTFLFTSFESCTYRELNHQPLDSQSTFLSTRLPGHQLGNHLIFLNMITRSPLAKF